MAAKKTKGTAGKKATKKAPAAAKKTKAAGEMLLVGSKTREALKSHGMNVAGDALEGLNKVIYWYIEQGAQRAQANGRKTVRPHDFVI